MEPDEPFVLSINTLSVLASDVLIYNGLVFDDFASSDAYDQVAISIKSQPIAH
jgi:hypothetical protein